VFDSTTVPEIVNRVIELLETRCIRLHGDAINWREHFHPHLTSLTLSGSDQEFVERMNGILNRAGLSHTAFFSDGAGGGVPARFSICATLRSYDVDGTSRWIVSDVLPGGPAQAAGVRPGDELQAVDATPVKPPVEPTFALGRDTTLRVMSPFAGAREIAVVLPKTPQNGKSGGTPPMVQPTSVSAARLEDDIGYVRVAFFPGASGRPFVKAFSRAMAELRAPQRLIVDLRGNAGGFVGSLWLMSHLVPDRLPVGYSLTRRAQDLGWTKDRLPVLKRLPASKLAEIWMFLRFAVWNQDRSVALWTQGLGDQPYHGRIVILTNEHTASSAEMVAAFAVESGAATIVGSRTKGEVLGGANYRVGERYRLRLPAAAWYTWRGEVVEGRGVLPHSEIALSLPDLQHGLDSQLLRARQLLQAVAI
jgi:carboxyl-terminal processing protease